MSRTARIDRPFSTLDPETNPMRSRIPPVVLALAALVAAPSTHAQETAPDDCPGDSASAAAGILEASRAFSRAMERPDAATMAAQYTDDAELLPPNGKPVTGIDAIEAFWTPGDTEFRTVRHELTTERLEVSCEVAVDLGRWRQVARRGDRPETDAWGRYLVVWRATGDGEWKMQFDAWTRPVEDGS